MDKAEFLALVEQATSKGRVSKFKLFVTTLPNDVPVQFDYTTTKIGNARNSLKRSAKNANINVAVLINGDELWVMKTAS